MRRGPCTVPCGTREIDGLLTHVGPVPFPTYPPELLVAHVDDLVAFHAAGGLYIHRLSGFLADEAARDGRADGDAAFLDVGLVLADDLPGRFLARRVLDLDGRAEHAAPLGVHE